MLFWITVKEGWKQYRYLIDHIPIDEPTEHFKYMAAVDTCF